MSADADFVRTRIAAELAEDAPPMVKELARSLARRHGEGVSAVLFYGSALGAPTPEGILDFYVLLDAAAAWPGSRLGALLHRVLPPMVGYVESDSYGERARAKYALMRMDQFARRMSANALDTTLWARFSQPTICVWHRAASDLHAVNSALQAAVITAAGWAAELGSTQAMAIDFWRALYAKTYAIELRVESAGRPADLVARRAERFDALLRPAWRAAEIDFDESPDGKLAPRLSPAQRRAATHRWARRARWGKPLNILRLIKAAFTFEGAMDYAAWKIERHSGVRVELRPWQRRFPLLAAPGLYWRLHKRGVLR